MRVGLVFEATAARAVPVAVALRINGVAASVDGSYRVLTRVGVAARFCGTYPRAGTRPAVAVVATVRISLGTVAAASGCVGAEGRRTGSAGQVFAGRPRSVLATRASTERYGAERASTATAIKEVVAAASVTLTARRCGTVCATALEGRVGRVRRSVARFGGVSGLV